MENRPKKGVRTQGGKKGIHILKIMGKGCWIKWDKGGIHVCVLRDGVVPAMEDLYIQGHWLNK